MMRSALVMSVAGAQFEGERDLVGYSYADYCSEFGKYPNDANREAIFNDNMAIILSHNTIPDKTWFATVNEFTDWTNDEFRMYIKGTNRQRLFAGEATTPELEYRSLPARVDWRDQAGVVTPPRDQGGCGSCWAFSAVETLESHLAITTGSATPTLSPQQIVSCAPNPDHCGGSGGCQGSTQPLAFDYTKTAGIATEADYPYAGSTGTCDTSKIHPVAYNDGYVELTKNNYTQLVTAVAEKGPVAISIAAGGMAFQFYGGGVVSDCNDYVMDHGVQLVGYGSSSGKDYWLVRNSWGGSWGEGGYIRVQRHGEGNEPCGTDNSPQDGDACQGDTSPRTYCGECAILSASSYPTGMRSAGPAPAPVPSPVPVPVPSPTPTPSPSPSPLTPGQCFDVADKATCESTSDEKTGRQCVWCPDPSAFLPCVTKEWGCNGVAV